MSKIKTITATTTEQTITFDATYQFVWFRSLGDGDVLVSDHSGIVEGTDDVALVKGGDSTRITVPYNKTVYVKAVSDSVDMEIHAQNFSDAPFEGGSGGSGGGGGSITIDPTPTQGSSNAVSSGGVYTALQGVSPINYSTTEQDTGRKWIDGKPIYQKTFTNAFSGLFTHAIWNNLSNVSISDIDLCVDVKISCHDTYGGSSYIAFLNAYYFRIYNGVVQLYAFEDWNVTIDAITIWYTKTTDTAE
jgi:hypothetical protein